MLLTSLKEITTNYRGVIFLCVAIGMNSWGMGAISPTLPLFTDQEFGVNKTQVGLAVGLHGIARLFISVPSGYMAQKLGRRSTLNVGTLINLLGAAMVAISFNYPWLLFWRTVSGLGAAMFTTGCSIYLRDVAPRHIRGRILSLQEMSILVGVTIGPYMGGLMGDHMGLRSPLYSQAILIIVALGLLIKFVPEPRIFVPPNLQTQSQSNLPTPNRGKGNLRNLLLNPAFTFVGLFSLMIVANRQGGRFSIMPLFAEAKGFRSGQIGAFISITHLPQFFTTMAAGLLSDRFGRKSTILPAVILVSIGILTFIKGDSFSLLLLSGVLLGLGEGLAGPPSLTFFADIAPPGFEGITMGLYRTFGGVGSLLGAVVLGGIADMGGFSWSLIVDGALLVASGISVMLLVKETGGRHTETNS